MGTGEYMTYRRGKKEINFEFQKLKGEKLLVKFEIRWKKNNIKMSLRKVVCGLGQAGSGDGPVAGCLITRVTYRVL